jgi:hypothetical protein
MQENHQCFSAADEHEEIATYTAIETLVEAFADTRAKR